MSNCCASPASVFSPFMAAKATFALKAAVWFRRGLLLIVTPDSRAPACPLSGGNSTYHPVRNCGATSRNAVHVHEHRARAEFRLEMPGERIVDQRGDGPGIVPPVGDEDFRHG